MSKKVLLLLDREDYKRLAELARREQREVHQQAQLLLRRALATDGEPPKQADDAA